MELGIHLEDSSFTPNCFTALTWTFCVAIWFVEEHRTLTLYPNLSGSFSLVVVCSYEDVFVYKYSITGKSPVFKLLLDVLAG